MFVVQNGRYTIRRLAELPEDERYIAAVEIAYDGQRVIGGVLEIFSEPSIVPGYKRLQPWCLWWQCDIKIFRKVPSRIKRIGINMAEEIFIENER